MTRNETKRSGQNCPFLIELRGMEMIVLRPEDQEVILKFETDLLDLQTDMDDMEKQLKSWHARWRKESLEHYLPLGWSFGIWSDNNKSELLGYVLCQPLLFFRGMTQTLWVEHLSAGSEDVRNQLGEIVYRWARDKHLQQLVLPDEYKDTVANWKPEPVDGELISVNTAKLRN